MKTFTIGHSNRSFKEFVDLLQLHNIQRVVDIRTIPGSRHNPQFNQESLGSSLQNYGIDYHHMKQLGGFRKASSDSPNKGWRSKGFRGFADYMQTEEFREALEELIGLASQKSAAIMCAEAVPWRCHRSLIADALTVRDVQVEHILGTSSVQVHQLNDMARVSDGKLVYPG
jgi:uncharacterized protein (DUF488 family)